MTRTIPASLFLALILAATPTTAARLSGVTMPDSASIDGNTVVLNGIGLRTKLVFKVYVAGLYLQARSADPRAILDSDQIRQVRMVMKRDLGRGKIVEAVEEGFEKNSKAQMPALRSRLDRFVSVVPDLEEGDELVITYVPGKGTTLTSSRGESTTVGGKDFADALFAVWLGAHPVDADLKAQMLGGS